MKGTIDALGQAQHPAQDAQPSAAEQSTDRLDVMPGSPPYQSSIEKAQGTVRDCTHLRARHQHGTYTARKKDGCGCDPCKAAARRYEKQRAYRNHSGRQNFVDPAAARRQVETLLGAGLTVGQIERRSGVNRTAIRVLIGDFPGRAAAGRIRRDCERALLAVAADRVGDETGGLVDPTGTARRIQALVAVGWTVSFIARRAGYLPANFTPVAHGRRPVNVTTRDAARAVYNQLWNVRPPTSTPNECRARTRAINLAAEYSWPPPLAWDDDTIDDPAAVPFTELEVHRANAAIDAEDVEFLLDQGLTLAGIAARLTIQKDSVYAALKRAGRLDVWRRISDREAARRTLPRRVA